MAAPDATRACSITEAVPCLPMAPWAGAALQTPPRGPGVAHGGATAVRPPGAEVQPARRMLHKHAAKAGVEETFICAFPVKDGAATCSANLHHTFLRGCACHGR